MTDAVAQVRRHLADIPNLIVEASHYLTPGTAPKDPDNRHGASIYRIPVVTEIVDLLDEREKDIDDPTMVRLDGERRIGVLPSLSLWVSLTYTELDDLGRQPRECCPARSHTVVGETTWLSEYAEPIIELHPDFPRDIQQLWNELRKACRVRKEYRPSCPNCSTDTHRNYLTGIYGAETDEYPAWWRCNACGYNAIKDAEIRRLAALQPKMTIKQISNMLGIAERTLHNWRSEGRFTTDSRGLAEVEHVREAARKTKKAKRVSA